MIIEDGRIIPNVGIGKFMLGLSFASVRELITDDKYTIQYRGNGIKALLLENAMLFFDKEGHLFQVGVTKGFKESFDEVVHIGCELKVLLNQYEEVYEEYDNYIIDGIRGIAFELEDSDSEDSVLNPEDRHIEWIYVYRWLDTGTNSR